MSRGAAGVAILLLATAGCMAGDAGEPGAAPEPPGRPLVVSAGDQGSFSTPCPYSHSGPDDPIVHPGHAGASHRHDFFGATTTGAGSTTASLLAGGTTCRSVADRSAYWAPALLVDGRPVEPMALQAYYRAPIGSDATQIEPPPNGLELLAGDGDATSAQGPEVVAWSCGLSDERSPTPVPCPQSPFLLLRLQFPPCWNGEDLGSADHRSHVAALAAGGACPDDHPVLLPQLMVEVRYPPAPDGATLALASGPVTGGHGDAIMAWDQEHIAREVDLCLRANRNCDVTSEATRLDVGDPPVHP